MQFSLVESFTQYVVPAYPYCSVLVPGVQSSDSHDDQSVPEIAPEPDDLSAGPVTYDNLVSVPPSIMNTSAKPIAPGISSCPTSRVPRPIFWKLASLPH